MSHRKKSIKRNQSLRKTPLTREETVTSLLLAGNEIEEEEEDATKILFKFDEDKVYWDPLTELFCQSFGEENENHVPDSGSLEIEQDINPALLAVPSSVHTPVKRTSPLSPTFNQNVQQHPQSPLPPQVEMFTPLRTTPKSDAVTSTKRKRKRMRISSGSDAELLEEQSSTKKQKKRNPTLASSMRTFRQASQRQNHAAAEPSTSETFTLPEANFRILEDYKLSDADPVDPNVYLTTTAKSKDDLCRDVQYELDEIDIAWLSEINARRGIINLRTIRPEEMELLIDRFEKEFYFEMQNSGLMQPGESDEDAVCCICLDGESDNSNQIIFCDMCNIPVHQDCYGVPFIPEGSYLCRRCSISPNAILDCIFCPNKDGAFKQTEDGRWAHVICALWIPEVRFSNASLVEPVTDVDDIPASRWKLSCFLCKQKGPCIQCLSQKTCYTAFHVTCGQAAGFGMKFTTNAETGVKLIPSCDKHTNAGERAQTIKKVESISKVINEKRATASEYSYPKISIERIEAACELVNFLGKGMFIKSLVSYWRLKRKSRGGAPLLRNLDSMWSQSKYPAQPSPLRVLAEDGNPVVEDTAEYSIENMKKWREDLGKCRDYWSNRVSHSQKFVELVQVKFQIHALKVQGINPIYQEVIKKLDKKDTKGIFFEPVSEEDAPEYFTVITKPMDLSTMEKKAKEGQYLSLDDLEADFNLMIDNCMTFNDDTTMFYKIAVKMREHGTKIFQDAKLKVKKQLDVQFSEFANDLNPSNVQVKSEGKTETKVKIEVGECPPSSALLKVLNDLLDRLAKLDKDEIFSEPVDPEEVPEYLTMIEKPMDFSTMRNKITTQQYSCVEDFEADFVLTMDNCMLFNDDNTAYYKSAVKMKKKGTAIIERSKSQMPSTTTAIVKIEPKLEDVKTEVPEAVVKQERITMSEESSEYKVMSDVLNKLIAEDDQQIFAEPVSLEDVPDYLTIIQTPMDFSLMQSKLISKEYSSLSELEADFNLMIDNCKRFNGIRSKYHKIAVALKEVGDATFQDARRNGC
ncbi:unnamed protein product [Orchesella dallaii]|uniref:Peregrin n=1 Tax=Orchesella dallaii TaxID=48710 RepID=A0ABP1QNP8_9HEXA